MTFTRYGIDLGAVKISFFGLIVLFGIAVGGVVAGYAARRRGEDASVVPDLLAWGLVSGLVVGRLFYIVNPPPSVTIYYNRQWYLTHFFDLQAGPLAIWSGGLGMAGVMVGATLAVVIALWRRRLRLTLWADILSPALMALLAITGWANVVDEHLCGPPTRLPWGMALGRRVPPYDDLTLYPPSTRFHPTPAYVALWALVALAVVWLIQRRAGNPLCEGDVALLTLAVYLPGLFLADFLRVDLSLSVAGLSGVQVLAALIYGVVVAVGVRRLTIRKSMRATS